jgi:regulator of protease activity HflC (stomatin/prohibitin superfamily)
MRMHLLRIRATHFLWYFFKYAAGLIETFGKFSRMLKPGLNMINPCSEEVRLVDLKLKVMSAGRHPAQTKDNVKVDIDASISYRITNPIIAHYILGFNLNRALIELTVSSLRDIIGQFTLDRVQIERIEIADRAK